MIYVIAVAVGALLASGCMYAGFYLGRINQEETLTFSPMPDQYGGEVLDYAVYPDQIADE